ELLDAVGLPRSLLPDVGGSAEALGRVTGDAAAGTGLAEGTPGVGGGADNACGAAGVGVIHPGEAGAGWGAAGTVLAPTAGARGAFLGLSLAHSRAHLARAVLEGVCFALRDSLTILQELGLRPAHLLLTGGGARSPFIRTLQAEVYGLPVGTVNREEGPAY